MSTEVSPEFAYEPALEPVASLPLRDRYGLFVGGAWVPAEDGAAIVTIDPATETSLALVARGGDADVDRAVRAARRGYEKYWRKLRPAERAKYLYRMARALGERAREFALADTLDAGTPIRETRDFAVPQAAAAFFYYAGWADKLAWAVGAADRVRPLGVVGAVVSWHAPLLSAVGRIAPALAGGNTVVLKPAETTPLSALLLAQLCAEADLPPGVCNVVTGDAETGRALTEHGDVDAIAFVGSTEAGKAIRRATAGSRKRLGLDLGGKAAVLIFDDAPLDQAVDAVVASTYARRASAGWAGTRVMVQENVAAEVVERLRERLALLRHGDPLDANTEIGPLHARAGRERVAAFVRDGIDDGATLFTAPWTPPERGFWHPAAFFTDVAPTHRAARDAVVGPVFSVMTFRTADEAIERANNVPHGAAASVWTGDGARALYTAQRLLAGVVWCNTSNRFDPASPTCGYKESGLGRSGGPAGLRAFLDT